MNENVIRMGHAYSIMRQALDLLGWSKYYDQLSLNSGDINELCYYSELSNDRDYPLCCIVRGILWDQVPALYQVLK